jgi:hypothetical protein
MVQSWLETLPSIQARDFLQFAISDPDTEVSPVFAKGGVEAGELF